MKRYKYPRTPHLPWSPGATPDDERLVDLTVLRQSHVVVTEKMDGENTTIYSDGYVHARSIDSKHHESRSHLKALAASLQYQLEPGFRICGENLYATHSIEYTQLPSWFMVYSIWIDEICLDWRSTTELATRLGLTMVPVLYEGSWPGIAGFDRFAAPGSEGYVVRKSDFFTRTEFGVSMAKWVRPNHVQTDEHWMHGQIKVNQLA